MLSNNYYAEKAKFEWIQKGSKVEDIDDVYDLNTHQDFDDELILND